MKKLLLKFFGGVVQMVEYMPCTHQVIGSNPITSKAKITAF